MFQLRLVVRMTTCCLAGLILIGVTPRSASGACPPIKPITSIVADGKLDDEARMVLDCNQNGIPDILEQGRPGVAMFRLDGLASIDLQGSPSDLHGYGAGPDGFRDAGFTDIPPCTECVQSRVGIIRVLSGMNTGTITLIYFPDSDGKINSNPVTPADLSADNSLLYVGMDIFNGNPRDVGDAAFDVHHIDFASDGSGTICNQGVADFNNDGVPDFLGLPFDTDSDGNLTAITRWSQQPSQPCSPNKPQADNAQRWYDVYLFDCAPSLAELDSDNPPAMPLPLAFFGTFMNLNGTTVQYDPTSTLAFPAGFTVADFIETYPFVGETVAQIVAAAQADHTKTDVEFVIKHIDTLVTMPANCPSCTGDFRTDRFRFAQGGIETLSDAQLDGSEEDFVTATWFVPLPQIEVKKEVRCVGEDNTKWRTAADALPGAKLEFRVTVENTGNVPLAVTLLDVLGKFGNATYTVDPTFIQGTYYPQGGAGQAINPLSPPAGISNTFFLPGGPGSTGFLGGTAATPAQSRLLGTLQGVDVCNGKNVGDKVEILFRVTFNMTDCNGNLDVDANNSITATGVYPSDTSVTSNDTPGEVPHDAAHGVDTPRESDQNYDDNVVTVNLLCRSVTFDKQVQYCPDCNCPTPPTGFSKNATIPPGANFPLCIRYMYTFTNNGETQEKVTIVDDFLCADIAALQVAPYNDDISLVSCEVCPPGTQVTVDPGTSAPPKFCTVRFGNQKAVDDFVAYDDLKGRTCDSLALPGQDDAQSRADCYSNCGRAVVTIGTLPGVCLDGIQDQTLWSTAEVCRSQCTLNVTKQVVCLNDCGDGVYDSKTYQSSIAVTPGSAVRFKITVTNTTAIGTAGCGACDIKLNDVMGPADRIGLCTSPNVKVTLNGAACNGVPANWWKVDGSDVHWLPSYCNAATFNPGDVLEITYDARVPNNAPHGTSATNQVADLQGYVTCNPLGNPAFSVTGVPAVATVNIANPSFTCSKKWSVLWDKDASCTLTTAPPDGFIDFAQNIDLGTADGGQAIVFPAKLCLQVTVTNNGDVDLNTTVTDPAFDAALASCGLTKEAGCELGVQKTVLHTAPSNTATWTCCVVVPTREKFLCLAQDDGGSLDDTLENTATVTANWGEPCPGGQISTSCPATIKAPPPCEMSVTKLVECIICPHGTHQDGGPAHAIDAALDSCERFTITVTNTSATVKIPRLAFTDVLTPVGTYRDNVKVTLDGTDVSSCFASFNVGGSKTLYRFDTAHCPVAPVPWLAPGKSLIVTYDVEAKESDLGGANSIVDTVTVDGYDEPCVPTGQPDNPSCSGHDSASINVKRPSITCTKEIGADYADGQTFDYGPSLMIDLGDPAASGFFPIVLKYRYTVKNDGDIPLANVSICDLILCTAANAIQDGLQNCQLDSNCCKVIGDLQPGETAAAVTCEVKIHDKDNLDTFLKQDNADPTQQDDVFINTGRVTGTANYAAGNVCPPPTPQTLTHDCQAILRVSRPQFCPTTKAKFQIYNENEVSFSAERCVTLWDQFWLTQFSAGGPSPFRREVLGTDRARARIDGEQSIVCGSTNVFAAPFLGVRATLIHAPSTGTRYDMYAESLPGAGIETGQLVLMNVGATPPPVPPGAGGPGASRSVAGTDKHPSSAEGSDSSGSSPVPALMDGDGSGTPRPAVGGLLGKSPITLTTQLGSLLVYPDVQVRWNARQQLIQDTFLSLNNDGLSEVRIESFIVNGDPPTKPDPCEFHAKTDFTLSPNEAAYWSVATGLPKGLAPITVVGPAKPDPDPANPGGTILRGYVVLYAVNADDQEINWNHLYGGATLVNYARSMTWEYNAHSFRAVTGTEGSVLLTPYGQLDLNGLEYDNMPSQLLFEFFTPGTTILSRDGQQAQIVDTELTLWIGLNNLAN